MTSEEFNEKYKAYLEDRHYGLAIGIPSVIDYLDDKFQELILVPGFKYSQIKLKFNSSRFYCQPDSIDSNSIEQEINKLVKIHDGESRENINT